MENKVSKTKVLEEISHLIRSNPNDMHLGKEIRFIREKIDKTIVDKKENQNK